MLAVIFELQPKQEKFDEYFKLAKYLKPKLEAIDGFIDIDRFRHFAVPRAYADLFLTRAMPHGLLGELALIGG
jgi:hypothetical protein